MTIKRTIDGKEITIELTDEERRNIYEDYRYQCDVEDVRYIMGQLLEEGVITPKIAGDLDLIAEIAIDHRDSIDGYGAMEANDEQLRNVCWSYIEDNYPGYPKDGDEDE